VRRPTARSAASKAAPGNALGPRVLATRPVGSLPITVRSSLLPSGGDPPAKRHIALLVRALGEHAKLSEVRDNAAGENARPIFDGLQWKRHCSVPPAAFTTWKCTSGPGALSDTESRFPAPNRKGRVRCREAAARAPWSGRHRNPIRDDLARLSQGDRSQEEEQRSTGGTSSLEMPRRSGVPLHVNVPSGPVWADVIRRTSPRRASEVIEMMARRSLIEVSGGDVHRLIMRLRVAEASRHQSQQPFPTRYAPLRTGACGRISTSGVNLNRTGAVIPT
jgi:hypothetical protein